MGAAVFRGVDPDAAAAVSLPTGTITSAIQFSMLSALPRPLQLAKVLLVVTTGVKSAACRMGGWHFTESLDARPAAEAQAPTEVYNYSVRKAKRKFRVKVRAGMRPSVAGRAQMKWRVNPSIGSLAVVGVRAA